MKKLFISLLLLILTVQVYSYNWEPYGPAGISAGKVRFTNGSMTRVICPSSGPGMYVSDDVFGTGDWEYYLYATMPVIDVLELNEENFSDSLIVLLRTDGYSDGIYSFNLQTHTFNPIHFCMNPNFIVYNEDFNKYFVGAEGCLIESDDLINWTFVPELYGLTCLDFACIEGESSCMVLVEAAQYEPCIYTLIGYNIGWYPYLSFDISFTDIESDGFGNYYAISQTPGNVGLYKSEEWSSINFELEYPTLFLSSLGRSSFDYLFLGWNQGIEPNTGLARYADELINISEGLQDKNINSLHSHDLAGWDRIYCCTNTGVFYCGDFTAGLNKQENFNSFVFSPGFINSNSCSRIFFTPDLCDETVIRIFDSRGVCVETLALCYNSTYPYIEFSPAMLKKGIYFLVPSGNKRSIAGKLIVF